MRERNLYPSDKRLSPGKRIHLRIGSFPGIRERQVETENAVKARIEAGWLIAPVKRWGGFGADREIITVEACAWIGSQTVSEALPVVRRQVKPVPGNLSMPEANGAMTDLSAGTLKSTKGEGTDANDKACKIYIRVPVKGSTVSDQGVSTPQLARGEAAGNPATSNKIQASPAPIQPITVQTAAPKPGYTVGAATLAKIEAMIRIDLGSPMIQEERLIKGVWKVAPPELIAALDFMGVESRKSASVGWRVCVVNGDNSMELAAGTISDESADRASKAAYAAALAAVRADLPPALPPAIPEAAKPAEKPAEKPVNGTPVATPKK